MWRLLRFRKQPDGVPAVQDWLRAAAQVESYNQLCNCQLKRLKRNSPCAVSSNRPTVPSIMVTTVGAKKVSMLNNLWDYYKAVGGAQAGPHTSELTR